MPPVTCYICGRDFGTRSIGIHIPSCTKKWENEQEKLPKSNRRPVPQAPENFDKVISGEIKGKDLIKMNQKAFDDYNETSLQSCQWCGRTFLPTALEHHRKACTEERPMVKSKGGYTSQMKARVQYPAMRSKKTAAPTATTAAVTASKTNGVSENIAAAAPAENSQFNRKIEDKNPEASVQRNENYNNANQEQIKDEVKQTKSRIGSPNTEDVAGTDTGIAHHPNIQANGYATFKKKPSNGLNKSNAKSKEQLIEYIEQEPLFDQKEHRQEVLSIIKNYVKEVRRKEILHILDHSVFDEDNNIDEIAKIMDNYIQMKTNNNNNGDI